MIKELLCISDVEEILEEFTPYLVTLRLGIVDKKVFAKKIREFGRVIVLSSNGENIGFAAFYCNDTKKRQAYLTYIAVKDIFSGLGYGKIIIEEVLRISKHNGMSMIKLEVRKDNINAIMFYKKMGFTQIEFKNKETIYLKKDL